MPRALPTDLEEMSKKLVYLIKVKEVGVSFRQAVDERQKIDLLTQQYELAKTNSEFCANKYETIYQMNRRNINAASAQHADHALMTGHREKFYKDYFSRQLDSDVSLVQAAKKKNSLSAAGQGSAQSCFPKAARPDLQQSDAHLQLRLKVRPGDQRRLDAQAQAGREQGLRLAGSALSSRAGQGPRPLERASPRVQPQSARAGGRPQGPKPGQVQRLKYS